MCVLEGLPIFLVVRPKTIILMRVQVYRPCIIHCIVWEYSFLINWCEKAKAIYRKDCNDETRMGILYLNPTLASVHKTHQYWKSMRLKFNLHPPFEREQCRCSRRAGNGLSTFRHSLQHFVSSRRHPLHASLALSSYTEDVFWLLRVCGH